MTALVDNKNLLLKAKLPKQTFCTFQSIYIFRQFWIYLHRLCIDATGLSNSTIMDDASVYPGCDFITHFCDGNRIYPSNYVCIFADIKHLYGVLLTLLMYMSAIFYPVTSLPPTLQELIGLNPVYMMIYIAREAVVYNHVPHYSAWIKLGISAIVSMAIGLYVFRKKQNDVMQRV